MVAHRFASSLIAALTLTFAVSAAEIRGVVVRVEKDRLVLEGRGAGVRGMPLIFDLDKDTEVLFGRQPGAVADLTPGRRVRLQLEDRGGRPVARVIHVLGARPQPAGPMAPTDPNTIGGTLQRVAFTDREIVVIGPGPQGPETETTIAVPETVKIQKGDAVLGFDSLKEGEPVQVRTEKRDGRLSAVAIQVGPGSFSAPAPERPNFLPRLRQALQMADKLLEQMEKNREKRP
jgi:cold shock CspA family protein